ncbi:Fis family transcriptional regulator [Desulfosarcina ovata subsp. sediminis]|uniref:Fis family transcriptional regulator n=1 Tax=Desulfosarcina ovata subsp. sediminis TaxID=885957 RepID=A0A5K7ZXC7_9BACT|nr:sigma-54 dependent transcriptional regulator [Desulfosarcina ovata]BBO84917.1 Fis family transcriptional regulator [Desulfosarcina ovata subsp. sediminis]
MKDVLIVCKDAQISRLIQSKLGRVVTVRTVSDIGLAEIDNDHPIDLVFMDVVELAHKTAAGFEKIVREFRRLHPLVQFIVMAPKSMVRQAVMAVRQGADDYLTYPIDGEEIDLVLKSVQENRLKDQELDYLRDQFWKSDWLDIIHTKNQSMRNVLERVRSVAPTIATVLLLGDTGTGKGLMARLIHRHSHRSDGPFVSLHCGAIPETLVESELFGHEKGAFTGADRRKIGKFEMAQEGTIFLDEIGTITHATQIKLLQVLQDGTFNRVGGKDILYTNARIIGATNADLEKMAETGNFRKDLYYRLNVFPIELPALRDRKEDLPHLVTLFLANLEKKYGKAITGLESGIADAMQDYSWPGNLRELENILERAYILESGSLLRSGSFPDTLIIGSKIVQAANESKSLPLSEARQIAIDEFERTYLENLLKKHKGRVNVSAKEAHITTRQLSRLAAKHGVDKKKYKS